jgi:hypothetical protein
MYHRRIRPHQRRQPLPIDKDGMFHFERGVVEIGHPPENPADRNAKTEDARLKRILYAYRLIDTGGKWTGDRNTYPYSPPVAFIDAKLNYYKILPQQQEFSQQKIDFEKPYSDNPAVSRYYESFSLFLEKLSNT